MTDGFEIDQKRFKPEIAVPVLRAATGLPGSAVRSGVDFSI
jgi:hypothetical protein